MNGLFSCQLEDDDDKSRKTLLIEKDKDSTAEKKLEFVTLDMSPQIEKQMKLHIGDSPPYPTPLNLVDGMQTPGTIYPPKSEIFWTRMQRTEFIHPITGLPKSTFGLKVAGGDNENTEKIYRSPNVDRPIRGAIGVQWDKEVPPFVSPKSCNINEISNSTAKYNEVCSLSICNSLILSHFDTYNTNVLKSFFFFLYSTIHIINLVISVRI